jgi:hypothetical protein
MKSSFPLAAVSIRFDMVYRPFRVKMSLPGHASTTQCQ